MRSIQIKLLLDLVGDIEIAYGDNEMVGAHLRAGDRPEPAVNLWCPCQQVPPAVGFSGEFDREVAPLGGRIGNQGGFDLAAPRLFEEEAGVRLSCVEDLVHDRGPEALGLVGRPPPVPRRLRRWP